MIKVLFVCLGNICRSPMAEAVFRHEVARRGLERSIMADSAGTGDWHIGCQPHEGTRKLLDRYGIGYEGMKARLLTSDDFSQFDYIVCMDSKNERDVLEQQTAGSKSVIMKLLDLIPESQTRDVPDPYFTGKFEEVYQLIAAGCERLIDHIMLKHNKDAGPI